MSEENESNQNAESRTEDGVDNNVSVPSCNRLELKNVTVKGAMVQDDTVFYEVSVRTGEHRWRVTKRYRQFEELNSTLSGLGNRKLPLLPAKHFKMWTDHTDKYFIEARRALLDNYVTKILKVKELGESQAFVNFCNDDKAPHMDGDEAKDIDAEVVPSEDGDVPEDQEVTGVAIPSIRKMSDHVLYQIEVTNLRKRRTFQTWTVLKRFGQFFGMDTELREHFAYDPNLLSTLPPAPPRRAKLIYDHMDDNFIEERRVLLENYLNQLLKIREVIQSDILLQFLGVKTDE